MFRPSEPVLLVMFPYFVCLNVKRKAPCRREGNRGFGEYPVSTYSYLCPNLLIAHHCVWWPRKDSNLRDTLPTNIRRIGSVWSYQLDDSAMRVVRHSTNENIINITSNTSHPHMRIVGRSVAPILTLKPISNRTFIDNI